MKFAAVRTRKMMIPMFGLIIGLLLSMMASPAMAWSFSWSRWETLVLENKDPATWVEIRDGTKGYLMYKSSGSIFKYKLFAYGLEPGIEYSLIYYADPWPGNNPGALITTKTTWRWGILWTSGEIDLGIDLPTAPDTNTLGAKIWLVPSEDFNGFAWTAWSPERILFERNLITYDDTDV